MCGARERRGMRAARGEAVQQRRRQVDGGDAPGAQSDQLARRRLRPPALHLHVLPARACRRLPGVPGDAQVRSSARLRLSVQNLLLTLYLCLKCTSI